MKHLNRLLATVIFCLVAFSSQAQIKAAFTVHNNGTKNATFNNTSSTSAGRMIFTWYWGDGNTFVTKTKGFTPYTYATIGTYNVRLIVSDSAGNLASDTADAVVYVRCIAAFDHTVTGLTGNFNDTSVFDTAGSADIRFYWYFFNTSTGRGPEVLGQNPQYTWNTAGTYKVILHIRDTVGAMSCYDSVTKMITIGQPCYVHYDYSVSNDTVVTFNIDSASNSGSGVKYKWYFGNGDSSDLMNPTYEYPEGSYGVCVKISDSVNNCSSIYCDKVDVYKCQASISYVKLTSRELEFSPGAFYRPDADIIWDFGDGTTSIKWGDVHLFVNYGTYKVKVTILDSSRNCFVSDSILVVISNLCNPDFTYTIVNDTFVRFYADSSLSNATNFFWDFGDGQTSNLRNPTHRYYSHGGFTVNLYVQDTTAGCVDSSSQYLEVLDWCYSHFTYTITGDTLVEFWADTVNHPDTKIEWNFGGGSTDTSDQHYNSRIWASGTTHYVCLKVSNATFGCNNTYCNNIYLGDCNAFFSYTLQGRNIDFHDSSTNVSGTTVHTWDFGDGMGFSNKPNPFYTYGRNADYAVTLHIQDSVTGCDDTYTDTVRVGPKCRPEFTYYVDSADNKKYHFVDMSTVDTGTTYFWSFGDGDTSVISDPSHTYSTGGPQQVCLLVTKASEFCLEENCKMINITDACNAQFTFSQNNDSLSFTADSIPSSTTAVFSWDFGGLGTSNQRNPNYVFPLGTHQVCLTVTDSVEGCSSSWCTNIYVVCKADFTYTVSGDTVTFTNTSFTGGASVSYKWYFGDGDSSTQASPTHIYGTTDTSYPVYLYMSGTNCGSYVMYNVNTGTPLYDIEVWVMKDSTYNNYSLFSDARIYLIQYDSATQILTAVDSADITTGNYHLFSNVPWGDYLVKAALLNSDSDYYFYMPTYAWDQLMWSNAQVFDHHYYANTNAVVALKRGTNPGGSGFIAGSVVTGANKAGEALEHIVIMLTRSDDTPVAFTETDAAGNYSFNNLAFGDYKVWVEILGKPSDFYTVTLDSQTDSVEYRNFAVNSTYVEKTGGATVIKKAVAGNYRVYPNPARNSLTIVSGNAQNELLNVTLQDMQGRQVNNTLVKSGDALDISQLVEGIYLLTIKDNNGSLWMQKIIKQ